MHLVLPTGEKVFFSKKDAGAVLAHRWYAARRKHTTYAATNIPSDNASGHTTLLMHQLITGQNGIDHQDRNGLNNRRTNLRPSQGSQNTRNQKSRPGSSKFKGVSWSAQYQKWTATITVKYKLVFLGRFSSEKEAARAYDSAARKHFRKFGRYNFPHPGELSAL